MLDWATLPWWARALGALPLIGGAVLSVRNAGLFDRLGTNIKTFSDPGQLVRDGAFEWTRNPMYLGFALMLAGIALLLGTAVAWIGPLAFLVAADRWYNQRGTSAR